MKLSQKETEENTSHGSVKSYTIGFILSIVVTLIPYLALTSHAVAADTFLYVAVGAAIVQLLVQLVLFLHLSFKKASLLNSILVSYTGVMVLTIVIGTLWVMHNLNKNMEAQHNVYMDEVYSPQKQAY
jgi:cytochrome o ubiquinol oxidase operon protein cyoD